jgi:prepilin-type N-terminal cleavage/methylation domain-containing protein
LSSSPISASIPDRSHRGGAGCPDRLLREHGFSLLELLPAIAIASLVVAGFTTFYLSEQRNFLHGRADVGASQDLRAALDQTTRDLRMAGRNPRAASSGCGFTVATANEVQFTFDADDNGTCGETAKGELRGFRRNANTGNYESLVSPGSVGPWEELATNVAAGTIFTYWQDNAGTVAATGLASIRRVDVTLRVNRTAPIGGVSRRESASVLVRNATL